MSESLQFVKFSNPDLDPGDKGPTAQSLDIAKNAKEQSGENVQFHGQHKGPHLYSSYLGSGSLERLANTENASSMMPCVLFIGHRCRPRFW